MALFTLFPTDPNHLKFGSTKLLIPATLEETHTDSLTVTEHPVERGAAITDHSYKNPPELVMKCGWSNSSLSAIGAIFTSVLKDGDLPGDSYIDSVYFKLLKMQEDRLPITVQSSKRWYQNMMITNLQVTTDQQTSSILLITITMKKVIIVNTKSAILPAKSSLADPASHQETSSVGAKQPVSG